MDAYVCTAPTSCAQGEGEGSAMATTARAFQTAPNFPQQTLVVVITLSPPIAVSDPRAPSLDALMAISLAVFMRSLSATPITTPTSKRHIAPSAEHATCCITKLNCQLLLLFFSMEYVSRAVFGIHFHTVIIISIHHHDGNTINYKRELSLALPQEKQTNILYLRSIYKLQPLDTLPQERTRVLPPSTPLSRKTRR